MAHDIKTLTDDRKMRAIAVLSAGGGNADAARAAGVSPASITGWMKDPAFRGELEETSRDVRNVVVRKARALFEDAIKSLTEGIRQDPKVALAYLKETGALNQIGRQLGLGPSTESQSIQVVINTGVASVIPVESVREAVVLADRSFSECRDVSVWPTMEPEEVALDVDTDEQSDSKVEK
jgi:hypothetical protein